MKLLVIRDIFGSSARFLESRDLEVNVGRDGSYYELNRDKEGEHEGM